MLKPCSLFSDGAVLCRNKEIRLFGKAEAGANVRAELRDSTGKMVAEAEDRAAADGTFLIPLPPQPARTGCELVFSDGKETVCAQDIAIGEVYLAGGQSNMEWELRNAQEGPEAIRTHEDPLLRFFNVPRKAYVCEEQQKAMEETRWEAIRPGEGGGNSAVAYFFARALRERHPELPVGVIGCYWGGTSITCWMDEETLGRLTEGIRYLERYAKEAGGKSLDVFLEEEKAFRQTLNAWNLQVEEYRQAHPGAPWKEVEGACGPCPWFPPAGPGSPFRPGGLAESMLKMIIPATLTGALFYQGESDADVTEHYDELMLAMIRFWRVAFLESTLPFLFVQLPGWKDWDAPETYRWAKLRQAQAAVRDAGRNTGMICLLDEGEYGNLHPTAKRVVGERLHALAESMIYGGEDGESPRALSKRTEGNCLTVTLSAPAAVRKGKQPALLEAAGSDGVFRPAFGAVSGKELQIRHPEIPHPVHARYAWTDYPDQANLFGENGLPVEPFVM